jgi:hypothetical protein
MCKRKSGESVKEYEDGASSPHSPGDLSGVFNITKIVKHKNMT